MGIIITNSKIILKNDVFTLKDIYDKCTSLNCDNVKKLNNMYVITTDLTIDKNAKLIMKNESLEFLGEYFTITKGSTFQMGEYDYSLNKCIDGCMFNAPNIAFKYGFGNLDYNNSGNLLVYGSILNAWGFWSFFEGNNHVELIDSRLDGFGNISGSNSIVRNVEFLKSNGRYGFLALNGNIKEYNKITVRDVLPYKGNKCGIYFNPKYSSNMVIRNSIITNYENLAYIEPSKGYERITILDSAVSNGYNVTRKDNNVDVFINYTFNPIIIEPEGSTLTGIKVQVYNNRNELVIDEVTDINGEIDKELTIVMNDKNNNIIKYNPFKIILSNDNITKEINMFINRKIDKHIIVFDECVSGNDNNSNCNVDYDKIKEVVGDVIASKTEFEILI